MPADGYDEIDALIDDTAREMTAAAPPAALRAAVRRRIQRPVPRPRTWQVGLAAASIVLVAFVAGRAWLSVTSEPALPRTAVEETVAAAAPAAGIDAPVMPPPPAVLPVVRRVTREAPLMAPKPIEIEPLVLQSVDPMVLAVETIAAPMPLDIRPIVVEPLSLQ